MNLRQLLSRATALVVAATLAACGGGTQTNGFVPGGNVAHGTPSANATTKIVGVGDSLMAGFQSNGFLGATTVANPLLAGTPFAGSPVPPGQESGFFSLFYQAANGLTFAQMANPATSVLPLIAGPGLGDQLVPANPQLTGGVPFSSLPTRSGCDAFNQSAFQLSALGTVRLNPTSTSILDLGVPGMTAHEILTMTNPLAPSCVPLTGVSPQIAGLQQIISGESSDFFPVLGGFAGSVQNPSQVNIAASLHPSLALLLIGANDILKFTFTGGQFAAGDVTTAQAQTDLTEAIQILQKSGAHVIVGDLPNVLQTPQFASVAIPAATPMTQNGLPAACSVQTFLFCILLELGQTPQQAGMTTATIAATYNLGTTGFVTESGLINALQGKTLDPNGAGSGLGANYITPAFATQVQAVNDAVNAGIDAAAQKTGAALVPIHTIFEGIASGNPSDPNFQLAASVNPGLCCTLAFGGGLLSFDGLHPSNTGYALLAFAFIQAANSAYGANIPQINLQNIYNGTPGTGPGAPFPDPYAQHQQGP